MCFYGAGGFRYKKAALPMSPVVDRCIYERLGVDEDVAASRQTLCQKLLCYVCHVCAHGGHVSIKLSLLHLPSGIRIKQQSHRKVASSTVGRHSRYAMGCGLFTTSIGYTIFSCRKGSCYTDALKFLDVAWSRVMSILPRESLVVNHHTDCRQPCQSRKKMIKI